MDQIKIGKFIAECRKNKNLTQMQLAEKLDITDRAVSKWENGKTMPDSGIMLELCSELGITVNELLSGERINMENKNEKQEELILNLAREVEEKNKVIWRNMWIIMIVSMVALFGGTTLIAYLIPEGLLQVVLVLTIVVLFLIPCFYALKLEVSVGYYKCKKCALKEDELWTVIFLISLDKNIRECYNKLYAYGVVYKELPGG